MEYGKPVKHFGYRSFYPWQEGGQRLVKIEYKSGDAIDKLEGDLAASMGHRDNHHGWEVETEDGLRIFLYFSDWRFGVWLLPNDGRDRCPKGHFNVTKGADSFVCRT